jgi:hypothetical protein
LAPWRLDQVAGRSSGQFPRASLDTYLSRWYTAGATVLRWFGRAGLRDVPRVLPNVDPGEARLGESLAVPVSKPRKRRSGSARRLQARRRSSLPSDPRSRIERFLNDTLALAEGLIDEQDPLNVETWASDFVADWYLDDDPSSPETISREITSGGLVAAAEQEASARSTAMLRALAALAPLEVAAEAERAASRLAAKGVPLPAWSEKVGRPELAGAWLGTDPFGDADLLLLAYRYDDWVEHALSILIDHNLGGIVKDAGLLHFSPAIVERMRADPELEVRELEPDEAAWWLRSALHATDSVFFPYDNVELHALRPLLDARARLLPPAEAPPLAEPPGPEERGNLAQEFLASEFAKDVSEADVLAPTFLDYKCDHLDGDPLRWSPTIVELFLCDFLPRKASLSDAEIKAMPDALRAWLRFTAGARGLPEHLVDQMLAAVRQFTPEFRRAVGDSLR